MLFEKPCSCSDHFFAFASTFKAHLFPSDVFMELGPQTGFFFRSLFSRCGEMFGVEHFEHGQIPTYPGCCLLVSKVLMC